MRKEILLLVTILLISALLLEAINLSVFAKYKDKHKHKKEKHMGLVYKDVKQVQSAIQVQTNSVVFVDDPQASLTFTLTEPRIALIIYSACDYYGTPYGPTLALGINVDAADRNTMEQSCDGNLAPGVTCFWIEQLAVGTHTIKGRYRMTTNVWPSQRAVIDNRRLTVILFEGVATDWSLVSSVVAANTANMALQNDPNALINLNLAQEQKALILYAACNYHNVAEGWAGKRIAVQVDATDSLALGNFPYTDNWSDCSFIAKLVTLSAGVHTIRGRFSSSDTIGGQNVTISERQLGVLLFDPSLETDYIESTNGVTIIGTAFGDDTEAIVSRNIAAQRSLLAIYSAGKHDLRDITHTFVSNSGVKVAINIDGTDYTQNNKGNFLDYPAVSSAYQGPILSMPSGNHTVKGRFASSAGGIIWIPERTLCLLWFVPETPLTPPSEAYQTKEEKQETNQASVLHGCTRLRMIHRVTRIVPWVV